MKHLLFLLFLLCANAACTQPERVAQAYQQKETVIADLYQKADCKRGAAIFLRAFKAEKELEVWAEHSAGDYRLLKTYPICATSGVLGRKLKEGDRQVPEGLYRIDILNPKSSFLLSLGLNYPNDADKIVAKPDAMGGDIYIHGACISIGCMAMTNDYIQEIYLMALEANEQGKTPNIHIFPFRMTTDLLEKNTAENPKWTIFWQKLATIYTFFETKHQLPTYKISAAGEYEIE
jgi:murein L,D-transpeptidase YafK